MKQLAFVWLVLTLWACRSKNSGSQLRESVETAPLPPAAQALWDEHIRSETAGKKIQKECWPKFYKASPNVPRRGMLMFFHGFTACPQQYFDYAEELSSKGWDVFLPLLPGQGREPFDGPTGVKDNFYDLPTGKDFARYQHFVEKMNQLAAAVPGPRVIGGLSGGASLAVGSAVYGQDLWDRALFYAPYFKNPGISGPASAVLDVFVPGYVNDWGPDCRATRQRKGGRNGLCALKVDSIRAMTDYGLKIFKNIAEIKIPVQIVGVEADATSDNGEIFRAKQKLAKSQLCFYPKGIPHSLLNPASEHPGLDPFWFSGLKEDSIAFITEGTWFPEGSVSSEYKQPLCRIKKN